MTTIVRLNKKGEANPPFVFIRVKLTVGLKSISFQVCTSAFAKPSSFRRSQAGPSSAPSTIANVTSLKGGGTSGDEGATDESDGGGSWCGNVCKPGNSASGFQVSMPSCQPRSVGTNRL